jgi:hypothetical protein
MQSGRNNGSQQIDIGLAGYLFLPTTKINQPKQKDKSKWQALSFYTFGIGRTFNIERMELKRAETLSPS